MMTGQYGLLGLWSQRTTHPPLAVTLSISRTVAATLSGAARRAASELYWPAVATRYCELGQRVMADHPQGSVVELRVSAT